MVKFLAKGYEDEIPNEINLGGDNVSSSSGGSIFETDLGDDGEEDDLYEEAKQTVLEAGKASTSYLQRKLSIGYSRAARLIDLLEKKGVIGPGSGAKPREVYGATNSTPEEDSGGEAA